MANQSSTMTKRQQQAAEMKLKIYRNAVFLFKTKPYESITIADICAASGISMGNFYHYFKDKNDVLNQAFQSAEIKFYDRIKDTSLPPIEQILFELTIYGEIWTDAGYRFMSVSMQNEILHLIPYKGSVNRPYFNHLEKLLAAALDNGDLINGNPQILYSDLIRVMKGTLYDWIICQESFSLVDELHRMANLVLKPYMPQ